MTELQCYIERKMGLLEARGGCVVRKKMGYVGIRS